MTLGKMPGKIPMGSPGWNGVPPESMKIQTQILRCAQDDNQF